MVLLLIQALIRSSSTFDASLSYGKVQDGGSGAELFYAYHRHDVSDW